MDVWKNIGVIAGKARAPTAPEAATTTRTLGSCTSFALFGTVAKELKDADES